MTLSSFSSRAVLATACAAAAALGATLGGCGAAPPSSNVRVVHSASGPSLTVAELERQLASGVRDALGRVAVMQQPKEGAADLGQDLPEGLVGSVRCAAPTAAPGNASQRVSTCRVGWRTAAGSPKRTEYVVRLPGGPCFAAQARPALSQLHDATIQTYSEHPLNRIFSLAPGC